MTDLEQHLMRQIAFSRATFGPGERTGGVIDHIRKELLEVEQAEANPFRLSDALYPEMLRAEEWVDVVILALDGLSRALVAFHIASGCDPEYVTECAAEGAARMIVDKQGKNEMRDWPNWRDASPDKAIEHVRKDGE